MSAPLSFAAIRCAAIIAAAAAAWQQNEGMPAPPPDVNQFRPAVHKSQTGVMPYRLFVPHAIAPGRTYPLIIWLHGAGGTGTDNLLQISGDQVAGTRRWTAGPMQTEHPSFVLVPQSDNAWESGDDTPELRTPLRLVLEVI